MQMIQWAKGAAREKKWRYVQNGSAAWRQGVNALPVTPVGRNALSGLRAKGVTTLNIRELTHGDELFERICAEYNRGLETRSAEIDRWRAELKAGCKAGADKPYLYSFTPCDDCYSFHHAVVQLALNPEILAIANAYQGMYTQLTGMKYWYTLADDHQKPAGSQLWHRDLGDLSYVKAFLYIEDVDEETGPLTYAEGTHRGSLRWQNPKTWRDEKGARRADDESMAAMVRRDRWFVATGGKGTLLIAVTTGYHKGGLATRRDRKTLYFGYRSPEAAGYRERILIDHLPADLHPAARFAAYGH